MKNIVKQESNRAKHLTDSPHLATVSDTQRKSPFLLFAFQIGSLYSQVQKEPLTHFPLYQQMMIDGRLQQGLAISAFFMRDDIETILNYYIKF